MSEMSEQDGIEKIKNEVMDNVDKKYNEKITELLEKNNTTDEELNKMLKMHEKTTIAEMINHDCNNSDCGICKMKNGIDQNAFKRGAIAGVKLGRKYPSLKVD